MPREQLQEELEYDLLDEKVSSFEKTGAVKCFVEFAQPLDCGKNVLAFPHLVLCGSR